MKQKPTKSQQMPAGRVDIVQREINEKEQKMLDQWLKKNKPVDVDKIVEQERAKIQKKRLRRGS